MKKIMLSLLCTGIVASASAQKNSALLFGDLGGNTTVEDIGIGKNKTSSFRIAPGIGYQLTDHWTFGLKGEISSVKGTPPILGPIGGAEVRTINTGGGVFARYTMPISNIFFFYTQADAVYTVGNSYSMGHRLPGAGPNTMGIRITPALGINIKNGYALNLSIGNLGISSTSIPGPGIHTTNIDYNLFSGASFGISKNFLHHAKPARQHTDAATPEAE